MRPAPVAQARGIRDPHRGQEPSERIERASSHLLGSEAEQWSKGPAIRCARFATCSGRRHRSASAAPRSRDAPEHDISAIRGRPFVERGAVHGRDLRKRAGWRTLKGPCRGYFGGLPSRPTTSSTTPFLPRTTSKLLVGSRPNGKFYSLDVAKTAGGGRGHGEAIRMFIDMEPENRDRVAVRQQGRPQIPDREPRRAGLCSSTRTIASAIPARASRCSTSKCRTRACAIATVAGDTVCGDRHQPQDGAVRAPTRCRKMGARPWRAFCRNTPAQSSPTSRVFDAKAGLTWKDSAGREAEHELERTRRLARQTAPTPGRLAHGLPKSNKFLRKRGVNGSSRPGLRQDDVDYGFVIDPRSL